jgi:hypothetical protein
MRLLKKGEGRMYNKTSKLIVTIIITAMIAGVIPTIRAAPPPAPAIWVTPENLDFETTHTHVGDKFNVTVMISTTGLSFTWQAKVNFNASQINAVRAGYTNGTSEFFLGHGTIPVVPIIDNATGFVVYGESLVGSDSVAATPAGARLFWIEFQVISVPGVGDSLTSLIDPTGVDSYILDPDLNEVPGVNFGSATYTYSPPPPIRDVAVTNLSLSNDHPKLGDNTTITVVVLNNGTIPETFDVTIKFDSTPIATLNVSALAANNSQTLTFEWNTSAGIVGQHTITASATVVPFDIDPTNNSKSKPITIMSSTGPNTDVNGDGKVDMKDIGEVGHAFGTSEGDSRWNPAADVNRDGAVNLIDIALTAKDFWKK